MREERESERGCKRSVLRRANVSESTRARRPAENKPETGGYLFHARKSIHVFAGDERRCVSKIVRLHRELRENERVVVSVRRPGV